MMNYQIFTFAKVKKFLDGLDTTSRVRVDRHYSLFEEYGTNLPTKYLKKVSPTLWELRPGNVRLFMFVESRKAYVVHGIVKKRRKIPAKELRLAEKRAAEFLAG